MRWVFLESSSGGAVLSLSSWGPISWDMTSVSSSVCFCSSQKCGSQKQLGVAENWPRLSGTPRAPIRLASMGVSAGRERMRVSDSIWDDFNEEWPGGCRPQRSRVAVVEKIEGARLEPERERLVMDAAGGDVDGLTLENEELEPRKLEVEVADVIVDARRVDALDVLEAVLGEREVESTEAGLLSRLVDAIEADRINFDIVVADVAVEARMTEALGFLEAALGWRPWRFLEAVDGAELLPCEDSLDEPATERRRMLVLARAMVAEDEYQWVLAYKTHLLGQSF